MREGTFAAQVDKDASGALNEEAENFEVWSLSGAIRFLDGVYCGRNTCRGTVCPEDSKV